MSQAYTALLTQKQDSIRSQAGEAIKTLKDSGVQCSMVSPFVRLVDYLSPLTWFLSIVDR